MRFVLFYVSISTGEKWEADLDREIRTHRSWRRYRLADYLRDYLRDHYPGECWVVIVYNDVSGFPKHTVQGYNYYHRFQYYGHNVVVSRIIPGPSVRTPDNLETILTRSYRKRPDCCRSYDYETGVIYPIDPWCHLFCILDAERTNHDTWDVLLQRVSPVMLHVVRDGISIASSWTANAEGYVVSRYIDGGFVTLLARQ